MLNMHKSDVLHTYACIRTVLGQNAEGCFVVVVVVVLIFLCAASDCSSSLVGCSGAESAAAKPDTV